MAWQKKIGDAECLSCGKPLTEKRRTKFCDTKCKDAFNQRRHHDLNLSRKLGLNTGTTGEINEMLVSIDLLKRGYHVYKPIDTTHGFDLLAEKGGQYIKVQVKTGIILPTGKMFIDRKQLRQQDVLAIVFNLDDIVYEPDLKTFESPSGNAA